MEQARNPHRKRQRRTRDPVAAAVSSKDSNKGGCNDSDEDDDDLQKILELEAAMGPVICEECGIRLKLRQAKYFMDMQIYLLHSNTIVTAIAFDDIVADLTGGDAEQFDKVSLA